MTVSLDGLCLGTRQLAPQAVPWQGQGCLCPSLRSPPVLARLGPHHQLTGPLLLLPARPSPPTLPVRAGHEVSSKLVEQHRNVQGETDRLKDCCPGVATTGRRLWLQGGPPGPALGAGALSRASCCFLAAGS